MVPGSSPITVTQVTYIVPVLSKEFCDIQAITVCRVTPNAYVT